MNHPHQQNPFRAENRMSLFNQKSSVGRISLFNLSSNWTCCPALAFTPLVFARVQGVHGQTFTSALRVDHRTPFFGAPKEGSRIYIPKKGFGYVWLQSSPEE